MSDTATEAPSAETDEAQEPTESPESPEEEQEGNELDDDLSAPQEPEASVAPPLTEKELEARMKRLDKEATRHSNAVSSILEDDANDLVPCPLCPPFVPGFRFPVPPSEAEWQAITTAVFGGEGADYAKANDANACPDCKALGQVLTGSLVASHRLKLCSRCGGAGYLSVSAQPTTPVVPPATEGVAPTLAVAPEPPPDVDPWGRDRSDPNFGRMPGYVT